MWLSLPQFCIASNTIEILLFIHGWIIHLAALHSCFASLSHLFVV